MKISATLTLLALSLIIKGTYAWWAAAMRGMEPVILSLGAGLAALGLKDQHNHEEQVFDKKGWFTPNSWDSSEDMSKWQTHEDDIDYPIIEDVDPEKVKPREGPMTKEDLRIKKKLERAGVLLD